MNITEKEKFESLWPDFIALVKGKLITMSAQQKLTTPLANLILAEVSASWGSEYEINGKWLSKLKETEAEKAELVRDILLNDIKFNDIDAKYELPDYYNYIIPAVGAGAGLAISMYFGGSKIIQAISTVVPAVLLYPAVKTYRRRMETVNAEKNIESYIQQLDKYKNSVISILS